MGDNQGRLVTRIGGRSIELSAMVEMLGSMLMSGGQGREKGHRQCGVLHCGYGSGVGEISLLVPSSSS